MKQVMPEDLKDGDQFVAVWEHNSCVWSETFLLEGKVLSRYDRTDDNFIIALGYDSLFNANNAVRFYVADSDNTPFDPVEQYNRAMGILN